MICELRGRAEVQSVVVYLEVEVLMKQIMCFEGGNGELLLSPSAWKVTTREEFCY